MCAKKNTDTKNCFYLIASGYCYEFSSDEKRKLFTELICHEDHLNVTYDQALEYLHSINSVSFMSSFIHDGDKQLNLQREIILGLFNEC